MRLVNIMLRNKVKSISITNRITFFYTLSTLAIIALIVILLYMTLTNLLSRTSNQFLFDELAVITNILKTDPTNTDAIEQEVYWTPPPHEEHAFIYYIRVLDQQHKVLIETPGMRNKLVGAVFPKRFKPNKYETNIKRWLSPDGKYYLLMMARVKPDKPSFKPKQVEVALDISYQVETLQ